MTATLSLPEFLQRTFAARGGLIDGGHASAFRLCNGFTEGCPSLALDVYGRTLVAHDYAADPAESVVAEAIEMTRVQFPWLDSVVVKTRHGERARTDSGAALGNAAPATKVCENGVWYALDLQMNRDASLYLDTRNLRAWAKAKLAGKSVLNTFAYTGSLGVAARAGGAARVVQLDRNLRFLRLASESEKLNGLTPTPATDLLAGDFFKKISWLKKSGARFDCVFVDPPFFSTSVHGTVDQQNSAVSLLNKVRPLIADGGWLVAVNNAVFLSGAEFHAQLESLCRDGFLAIEELIPVPEDFAGFPTTRVGVPPANPAPFNHSTKIAVLRVKRKAAASPAAAVVAAPAR